MSKSLSERLAEAIETVCENGMDTRDIVSLFRESEAIARRVEGAAKAIGSRDACTDECASIIMHIGNGGRAKDARGKWFHLVPVEGGA